jgi:hypothetical protein
MKLLNPVFVLCQVLIAAFAISIWPVGLEKMGETGSNCEKPIGQPESLNIGGMDYHYQYDAKGRVISRRNGVVELRFEYVWRHDRPIHITQSIGNAGQPAWEKFEQHFIYNQNEEVVYARDVDGRAARFGYNDAGDLVWMESLNGIRMEVSYDPVCDQPRRYDLRRLGHAEAGSITFTYDSACKEIEKKFSGDELVSYLSSTRDLLDQIDMDLFH